MNRVLGCFGAVILCALVLLAAGIATVLIMADSGPGPDGSPAHPYPSVTPYPGRWEPK